MFYRSDVLPGHAVNETEVKFPSIKKSCLSPEVVQPFVTDTNILSPFPPDIKQAFASRPWPEERQTRGRPLAWATVQLRRWASFLWTLVAYLEYLKSFQSLTFLERLNYLPNLDQLQIQ